MSPDKPGMYGSRSSSGRTERNSAWTKAVRALLGGTRKDVKRSAPAHSFPFLPAGCLLRQLDPVARDQVHYIIRQICSHLDGQRLVLDELRKMRSLHMDCDLATFLDGTGLDLDDVYANNRCWSDSFSRQPDC